MVPKGPQMNFTHLIWLSIIGMSITAVLFDSKSHQDTGKPKATGISQLCANGIVYYNFYEFTGAISVALDQNGKVIRCGG